MEYVDGSTLADRLREGDVPDVHALAHDLLAALDHIHRAGIVHRDVKPANVLVPDEGRVRLTDFGIALGDDTTGLTRTGVVVGTARYLAPEVAGGAPATPQSDLYALGVLLHGCHPSDARIQALVARLTAERPAGRPASAAAALLGLKDEPGAPAATGATRSLAGRNEPGEDDATALRPARERAGGPVGRDDMGAGHSTRVPGALTATAARPPAAVVARRWAGRVRPKLRETDWVLFGATVALLVLALIGGAVGDRRGSAQADPRLAPLAPRDAPVDQQLQTLDRLVRDAER